jgi:hypothetical protein
VAFAMQRKLNGMTVLVSGFFDLDAMNFVECPRCRLPAGKICIDHRGKKLTKIHPERAADYRARFKDRASLYIDGPVQIEKVREYNRKLVK